jgi:hypothetical protein
VDLDGFAYELRGTSTDFVREASKLVHLPRVERRPAVVFSAVSGEGQLRRRPVLSLYQGCHAIVRTLSREMLLKSFLSELRTRALGAATDRVFLKAPALQVGSLAMLLPATASRRLVRLERAAARSRVNLGYAADLVLDLKTGQPVHEFGAATDDHGNRRFESIDVVAVEREADGSLPSRADLLFELAQRCPNLHRVGSKGLDALGSLVERAQLIEWDEAHPDRTMRILTEGPFATARVG